MKRRFLVIWLAAFEATKDLEECLVCPMFARISQGVYQNLLQELRSTDPKSYFLYLRMSKEGFDVLLLKLITVTTTTVLTSAIVHTVDILPSR